MLPFSPFRRVKAPCRVHKTDALLCFHCQTKPIATIRRYAGMAQHVLELTRYLCTEPRELQSRE